MTGTARWANAVTYGSFWTVMLLGFCIVLTVATFRYGKHNAVGYGAVVGLFGALFLATIGLMQWGIAAIFILVGAFGLVWMVLNRAS